MIFDEWLFRDSIAVRKSAWNNNAGTQNYWDLRLNNSSSRTSWIAEIIHWIISPTASYHWKVSKKTLSISQKSQANKEAFLLISISSPQCRGVWGARSASGNMVARSMTSVVITIIMELTIVDRRWAITKMIKPSHRSGPSLLFLSSPVRSIRDVSCIQVGGALAGLHGQWSVIVGHLIDQPIICQDCLIALIQCLTRIHIGNRAASRISSVLHQRLTMFSAIVPVNKWVSWRAVRGRRRRSLDQFNIDPIIGIPDWMS